MIAVVDTSVLVSAALAPSSTPGSALDWVIQHGELLLSPRLLAELEDTLYRRKFDRRLSLATREKFIAAIVAEASYILPTSQVRVCRDPKDDHILALAVDGGAQAIISGDKDLLVLNTFRDIRIVNPSEFLAGLTYRDERESP